MQSVAGVQIERGRLEEHALPDLLCALMERRETGVLHLIRHGVIKSVYLDKGRIVFASSTDRDDRLGELLLRRGLIRVQQLENALACRSADKRLGGVLVEMGYLDAENLIRGVSEQVREIVFGLFLWTDGEYRFEAGDLPTREVITLRLSTPEVILGGIGRIDRWWRVLPALGDLESVFRVRPGRDEIARQLRLNEGQERILQVLAQPTSVRDLCGLGALPDFEACQTLWAFRVMGLAEPTSEPARRPAIGAILGEGTAPDSDSAEVAIEESGGQPAAPAAPRPPAEAGAGLEAASAPTEESRNRDALERALGEATAGHGEEEIAAGEAEPPSPGESDAAAASGPADEALEIPGGEAYEIPEEAEAAPAAVTHGQAAAGGKAAVEEAMPLEGLSAQPAAPQERERTPVNPGAAAALAAFNGKHRRLFALLQEKMGLLAPELVARALKNMSKEIPAAFSGVEAGADGTLPEETLGDRLSKMDAGAAAAALDLLFERELEAVAGRLGPAARRDILSRLR